MSAIIKEEKEYAPMKQDAIMALLDRFEQDFAEYFDYLTQEDVEAPFDFWEEDNWDFFIMGIQDIRNYIKCSVKNKGGK